MPTAKKAKKNEIRILDILNSKKGTYQLANNEFSVWDIYGHDANGDIVIIEIKERRSIWNEWFIEVDKIDRMYKELKVANKIGKKAYGLLIITTPNGDDLVYHIDKISKCKKIKKLMNRTTAKGFYNEGVKVEKEVYIFPLNSYVTKLN